MEKKTAALQYKGHPLRRKDNLIYFGSMADKYIIMLQILDTKNEFGRRRPDNLLQYAQFTSSCRKIKEIIPYPAKIIFLFFHHGPLK